MASTSPSAAPHPVSEPVCPVCASPLARERTEDLDAWVCPEGHGLGFTLSEAYERIGDDEVKAIWQVARRSPLGSRACPICGAPMVTVQVAPTPGGTASLLLDVCLADELFWFDAGELDEVPDDGPDPAPSATETARIEQLSEQFGDALSVEWSHQDALALRDRLLRRVQQRSPSTP
jgi:Zn-finger nucleic acid-binding protein